MKILLTGTHFTPAVAVIEELKKFPNVKLVYVGRKTTLEGDPSSASVESQVLPKTGVKFIPIITGRLQKTFTIYTIPSLLKIPIGFIQAVYIILKERPDVILSFGGYVAVPIVVAGWLFSIPIICHEQTLSAGLANYISSFFADKIALSFGQVKGFDNDKTILTGNPIRGIIKEVKEEKRGRSSKPTILVTGGNQGSHVINLALEEILDKLTKIAVVFHISGDNNFGDFDRLSKLGNFGGSYLVKKWIGEEYGAILQKADLVVSRAGINTLTELSYLGKPALVIPLPYLWGDEQNKNAKFFESLGLVQILPQSKLSGAALLLSIKKMLNNLNHLREKAKEAKKVLVPDSAKRLALETALLVKKT